MKYIVEVCAGSVEDSIQAQQAGADRIELNNGLYLGGLTPSYATVKLSLEKTEVPIIAMVRPRGGGFHYSDTEVETMFMDARHLLELGVHGLAFGFLDKKGGVDVLLTKKMVDLCHEFQAEAVFHRAFDVVEDPYLAINHLIECGVDRLLSSGLKGTASEGSDLLKNLQDQFGSRIELLMGSGINEANVEGLISSTGIHQVHASFKGWFNDQTTASKDVSYSYSSDGDYDGVDREKLDLLLKKLK